MQLARNLFVSFKITPGLKSQLSELQAVLPAAAQPTQHDAADATSVGGTFHWWIATFPGLAIFLTVFSYTLVGEALRDAIDPRTVDKSS